jgi:co-chaperonin GroES (HSP10)
MIKLREVGTENIVVVSPSKKENLVKIGEVELLIVSGEGFNARSYNSEEELEAMDDEQFEAISVHDSLVIKTEGTVVSAPWRLTRNSLGEKYGNDVELKAGDYVYFHHNVIQEQFDLHYEGYYWSQYERFYARKREDGSIQVLGDNCLALPVKEEMSNVVTDSGIWLKNGIGNKFLMATITHLGRPREGNERRWFKMWSEMVVGNTIIYDKDSNIKIKIEEEEYFRMKFEDIVAVVSHNGKGLFMQNRFVLLEQAKAPEEISGILIPGDSQKKPERGVVVDRGPGAHEMGVYLDDEVFYHGQYQTEFRWNDKDYVIIDAMYIYLKTLKAA